MLGNGNNTVTGPRGNTAVTLGTGANVVTLAGYNNTVTVGSIAGGGTSYINAGAGNETVTGGNGNFVVLADGFNSKVVFGNGNNWVFLSPPGANPSVPAGTAAPIEKGGAVVTTGSGNDTMKLGGYGNQVDAGGGTNIIYGGLGNDTFMLPPASRGLDTITGFTEANGDVLDLRAALAATGWNHTTTSTLANWLVATSAGGDTTLSVRTTAGGAATAIAVLHGSGALGVADLLSHNSLRVA